MNAEALYERSPSVSDAEHWLALGTGALLLIVGASRRSVMGACLAASSVPLLYRGITGRWPNVLNGHLQPDNTRALGGFAEYAEDQAAHHPPPPGLTDYLTSARFWFESFQNWQSEFLAIASMVWLAVYLRQRWSPESKPVHAPHSETGR